MLIGSKDVFIGSLETIVIENPQAREYEETLSNNSDIIINFNETNIEKITVIPKNLSVEEIIIPEQLITNYNKLKLSYENQFLIFELVSKDNENEIYENRITYSNAVFLGADDIEIENPQNGERNYDLSNGISKMKVKIYTNANNMTSTINVTVNQKNELYSNTNSIGLPKEDKKITDYTKVDIAYNKWTKKIDVHLTGKDGTIGNKNMSIDVAKYTNYFNGLQQTTISNLNIGSSYSLKEGIIVKFSEKEIQISVSVTKEVIILSYPMSIKDYVNIEIEVRKKENKDGDQNPTYTAKLFVDGEKMEESIEMSESPKINNIGGTYIRKSEKYFIGNIKNIELYN